MVTRRGRDKEGPSDNRPARTLRDGLESVEQEPLWPDVGALSTQATTGLIPTSVLCVGVSGTVFIISLLSLLWLLCMIS